MAANLFRARKQGLIARVVRYKITGRSAAGDGSKPPGLVLFRLSANHGRVLFRFFRVRYRFILAVCSRGAVCPVPRERWHDSRVGYEKMQVHAHKRAEMWYHIRRQFKNRCVRRIGWHCWNLRNFIVCAKRSRECTRSGACLSRGPHRAFSGPQQEHGRRVRPLSSPMIGKRALEKLSGNNRHSREKKRAPT